MSELSDIFKGRNHLFSDVSEHEALETLKNDLKQQNELMTEAIALMQSRANLPDDDVDKLFFAEESIKEYEEKIQENIVLLARISKYRKTP